jgi:hypothetical protein
MTLKKLFAIGLLLAGAACQQAWAQAAASCPYGYRIAFFNGINTTPVEAGVSILRLQDEFGMVYKGQPLLYARFENPTSNILDDLAESFTQAVKEYPALQGHWDELWRTLVGTTKYDGLIRRLDLPQQTSLDVANRVTEVIARMPAVQVSSDMVAKFNTLMDQRQKIVGVGHSQGNWFLLSVYKAILTRETPGQHPTSFVHVATFTRDLAGPYTNNETDQALRAGRSYMPEMQPSNVDAGTSFADPLGHGFVTTYMNKAQTRMDQPYAKVRADILAALEKVKEYPCLAVTPSNPSVVIHNTLQLAVASQAPDGSMLPNPPGLAWQSSQADVAAVSPSGVVTALKVGTTVITVFDPVSKIQATTTVKVTPGAGLPVRPLWELIGPMSHSFQCRDKSDPTVFHTVTYQLSQGGLMTQTAANCNDTPARSYQYVVKTSNALQFSYTDKGATKRAMASIPHENGVSYIGYTFDPADLPRQVDVGLMQARVAEYLAPLNGRTCSLEGYPARIQVTGTTLSLIGKDATYTLDLAGMFSGGVGFIDQVQYDTSWLSVYPGGATSGFPTLEITITPTSSTDPRRPYDTGSIRIGTYMRSNGFPLGCGLDSSQY